MPDERGYRGTPPILYLLKLMPPLDPHGGQKTASKVATMKWVREKTNLSVPRVKAWCGNRGDNVMGLEWILMEYLGDLEDFDDGGEHGDSAAKETKKRKVATVGFTFVRPLSECWHEASTGGKKRIVEQLVRYCATMYEKPFLGGIGNLYFNEEQRGWWPRQLLPPPPSTPRSAWIEEEVEVSYRTSRVYAVLLGRARHGHQHHHKRWQVEADQHTGREAHAQAHRPPPSSAGHLLEGPSSSSICLICTASSTSHADISLS